MAANWLSVENGIKCLAWMVRKVNWPGAIWQVREIATAHLVKQLHLNLLHRMRKLAVLMQDWDDREAATHLALEICSECRRTMCLLLELKPNDLHCCIKILTTNNNDPDEDRVATWVRSEPLDGRPVEAGDANAHLVTRNSVWSALLYRNDGKTQWGRPFTCFCCNDLTKHAGLFQCDRENWGQYYQSALVFAVRYPKNLQGNEYAHIGFLTFDSVKKDVFRGLPDIFDHRDNPTHYRQLLEGTSVFHVGSIIADTLATFLRPIYERGNKDVQNGNQSRSA